MFSTPGLHHMRPKLSTGFTSALMLTYRPIIFLLFAAPTFVMLLPFIAVMLQIVVGNITDQHELLTLCMTVFFSKILESLVTDAAPTKEIGIKSLKRSRGQLVFATFSISLLLTRLVVIPLEKTFGLQSIFKYTPSISIMTALRLTLGGLLLGLSVVARYIGPLSIVRCSSSLLLVNSYPRSFRSVSRSTSPSSSSPKILCRTDDTRGNQLIEHRDSIPRRLQLPASASLSAQIVITISIAICLAYTSVFPLVDGGASGNICSATKTTIIFSCITFSTMQLLLTTIKGTNHEIDPKQYQSFSIRRPDTFINSLATAIRITFSVHILVTFVHFRNGSIQRNGNLAYLIIVPYVIISYLYIFDYVLRILICATPSNMKQIVEEAYGGDVSTEMFVDIILRSLLHSNDGLVNLLGNVPKNLSVWMNVEEEELKLNSVAIKLMADSLLYTTNKEEMSPRLEDDIFRLAILSCIGGSKSIEEGAVGDHTESDVNNWTRLVADKPDAGRCVIDSFALPIVRALCAYAGGFGEALRLIAVSWDKNLHGTWEVPPGALFMVECAIRGATHRILRGVNFPRSNTSVAILISLFLNSAYKLENNILRYCETINPENTNEVYKVKPSQTAISQFLPLINVCGNCTNIILQTAKEKEELHRFGFYESVDTDYKKWQRSKMSPSFEFL